MLEIVLRGVQAQAQQARLQQLQRALLAELSMLAKPLCQPAVKGVKLSRCYAGVRECRRRIDEPKTLHAMMPATG
jgi:hypothetical protein